MKTVTVASVSAVAGGGGATVSLTSGQFAIVCTAPDTTLGQPAQQITVGERPAGNLSWTRNMQLTDEAVKCQRYGSNSVALLLTSWAKVCVALEPSLTFPVVIATAPTTQTCVHASTTATFELVLTENELPSTYQWQECSTVDGTYSDVANVTDVVSYTGGTTDTLVVTPTTTDRDGYYYKCVVTNANGDIETIPVALEVT